LEKRKTGGRIRYTGSWELISPKNSRIPQRSQEIANGGLEGIVTVVLERMRVGSERIDEGVSSVWIVKPTKTE
jgi:hypothetical protein